MWHRGSNSTELVALALPEGVGKQEAKHSSLESLVNSKSEGVHPGKDRLDYLKDWNGPTASQSYPVDNLRYCRQKAWSQY